jgi:[ribosomal protein S5]-alanine N-acetyltransferase
MIRSMSERRVYLRDPGPNDAAELVAAMRASASLHGSWITPPTNDDEYTRWLERMRGNDFVAYLICRRADRAIVGVATLSQIFYGPLRSAYLGYAAVAEFAGRGYMTEGIVLVVRRAFRTLRLHRVEANVQPGNLRSRELLKRCGFTQEGYSPRYLRIAGRWRDHERWALLSEDFRAGRGL